MKIYHITHPSFQGYIEITFSDRETFTGISFAESEVTEKQQTWFMGRIPVMVKDLSVYKIDKDMQITEVSQGITFDAFWSRYNDKVNSSKKKTEARWNKMSATEQVKAFRYIDRYFASIPFGTRKKYAETYLNAELWNN
jgi:hypothetical protein